MDLYQIKLKNTPNQSFLLSNITLGNENRTFKVDLSFSEICGYWNMTLTDWSTKEEILSNIPLVTGQYLEGAGNNLAQFAYKGVGKFGICRTVGTTTDYPNDKNLYSDFVLIWLFE